MRIVKGLTTEHNQSRDPWQKGQAGQAVIEYLLLVIVGIVLLLMLKQVYKPLETFMQFYMTDHLQCLLETGELPGPGGRVCGPEFQAKLQNSTSQMKVQNIGATGTTGTTGGSSSTTGSGTEKKGTKSGSQSGTGAGANAAADSGGGAGENAQGPRRNSAGRSLIAGQLSSDKRSAGGKKDGDLGYTGSSAVSSGQFGSLGDSGRQRQQRMLGAFEIIDNAVEGNRTTASSISTKAKGGSGESLRPAKTRDTYQARKLKAPGDEPGFSIGFALRILIILAIIIALVLLIGGQLLQISKSLE